MNPDVLAPYTPNIAQGKKNDSRINGCLVLWVGGSQFTARHIMLYFHIIFPFHIFISPQDTSEMH